MHIQHSFAVPKLQIHVPNYAMLRVVLRPNVDKDYLQRAMLEKQCSVLFSLHAEVNWHIILIPTTTHTHTKNDDQRIVCIRTIMWLALSQAYGSRNPHKPNFLFVNKLRYILSQRTSFFLLKTAFKHWLRRPGSNHSTLHRTKVQNSWRNHKN